MPSPSMQFDAELVHASEAGGWIVFEAPGSTEAFGTGKPVRVVGTLDAVTVALTLLPSGHGYHLGPVKAATRKMLGKDVGDTITVRIEAAA
ncbi:DUF1905 domain-containing protein [Microbacterium esteraromaticum]|uniref:DUF1905 domain-containing protein n=1 Tax=Microbacterium esteraromaticum TaxID=57043 RepID=UPI001CD1AE3F|nr:DUF1905 domain-containing protein [Microbacterium esteraromaticum]MCA1306744.1 DUF1905 domain-containing protein [Microbacterium esteraromaticum]